MLLANAPTELRAVTSIKVVRESRQRQTIDKDVDVLAEQMANAGQIQAIVIHSDGTLIAGERRLTAAKKLGWSTIRCMVIEALSQTQAFLIELLENIARKQLPWQDEARAILNYHNMRASAVPEWTHQATAQDLGVAKSTISMNILVAKRLEDPEIAGCQTLTGAFNLLRGRAERAQAAASNRGLQIAEVLPVISAPITGTKEERTAAIANIFADTPLPEISTAMPDGPDPFAILEAGEIAERSLELAAAAEQRPTDDLILTADFLEWSTSYTGPKFDVIHCDFPYGKNFTGAKTRMSGQAHVAPRYADDPDIMWTLLEAFLANQDNFCFPVAHCIFWFDMRFYQGIMDSFVAADWRPAQDYPLIWVKPGQGIPADPKRRPVHTYETAMLFSRGDRRLARLKADYYEARIDEKLHINQKPATMLQHFLSLVVDEHSAVLDPTCGSGTSLVAARALKAQRILGLELDPSNAEVARFVLARPTLKGTDDAAE